MRRMPAMVRVPHGWWPRTHRSSPASARTSASPSRGTHVDLGAPHDPHTPSRPSPRVVVHPRGSVARIRSVARHRARRDDVRRGHTRTVAHGRHGPLRFPRDSARATATHGARTSRRTRSNAWPPDAPRRLRTRAGSRDGRRGVRLPRRRRRTTMPGPTSCQRRRARVASGDGRRRARDVARALRDPFGGARGGP